MNHSFKIIFLLFLFSCQNDDQSNTTTHTDSVITDTSTNTGIAIVQNNNFSGYYTGMIPCADCEGINQSLLLTPDHHFHLKEQYINTNSAPIIIEGKWADKNGKIILSVQDTVYRNYAFEDSILVMLDRNEKRITGKLAANYHLKRSWIGKGNKAWNKMKRDGIDFLIVGNEPFWSLMIDKPGKIIFTLAEKADKPVTFTYAEPKTINGDWVYQLSFDGEKIEVFIQQEFCSDGMSDNWYEYSAEVIYNGKTYKGCGVKMGAL